MTELALAVVKIQTDDVKILTNVKQTLNFAYETTASC